MLPEIPPGTPPEVPPDRPPAEPPAGSACAAQALELTIEVTGARSARGHVAAALYAGADGWLKQAAAGERVVAGERVTIVFRNLAPGTYALAVFHDENGNGRLDANVAGIPTEPFGFSRDARGTFGPPKFPDAAVELTADATIKVARQ